MDRWTENEVKLDLRQFHTVHLADIINNNCLLSEGEIQSSCLDVGRIIGNFYFSVVPMGTLGLISPVREEIRGT